MFWQTKHTRYITSSLLGVVMLVVGLMSFSPTPAHGCFALLGGCGIAGGQTVQVNGGSGTTQQTISAAADTALVQKEFVYDQIAFNIARTAVASIVRSIVNWINSGFQGEPAFVQDLEMHMQNLADATAGEFIRDIDELEFLCSPFRLDVRTALDNSYRNSGFEYESAQCTLSDVTNNIEGFLGGSFNQGGWDAFHEVTSNPINTPTGAYLASEAEMRMRIVDARGEEIQQLNWGDGFLSYKECTVTNPDGSTTVSSGNAVDPAGANCRVQTPGAVIADQINTSLGLGAQQLITADEINEIIGALIGQLAQQALTGVNGLLGLSSGGPSTNGGSSSYLDDIAAENSGPAAISRDLFGNAIELEEDLRVAATTIVSRIQTVQDSRSAQIERFPNCFEIFLQTELREAKQQAQIYLIEIDRVLPQLRSLEQQFEAANTSEEQLRYANAFSRLQSSGDLHDISDLTQAELFIDNELPDILETARYRITNEVNRCEPLEDDDD